MREGEELKAPRHASAAVTRDGNLQSRDGSLPYLTVTCLFPISLSLKISYTSRLLINSIVYLYLI